MILNSIQSVKIQIAKSWIIVLVGFVTLICLQTFAVKNVVLMTIQYGKNSLIHQRINMVMKIQHNHNRLKIK